MCAPFLIPAQEPATSDIWDLARSAYDQEDFSTALTHYQTLREQGTSAALEYNLGNTHYRLGHIPEAIAHYRRAQWLRPDDPDVQANLDQAIEQTGALVPNLPPTRKLSEFLTPTAWQKSFLVSCWLIAGVGILSLAVPQVRNARAWTLPLLIFLLILTGCGTLFSRPTGLQQEAVLNGNVVTARFEPLTDATEHFSLPGGSVVHVKQVSRNWVQIVSDEKSGWVNLDHALLLKDL
jgi:tetratricopeptide (TPR) repeat protein